MIKRRNLRTRSIKLLILDESDEMLNKGNAESQNHRLASLHTVSCIHNIFPVENSPFVDEKTKFINILRKAWQLIRTNLYLHRFQRANIRRLSFLATSHTGLYFLEFAFLSHFVSCWFETDI